MERSNSGSQSTPQFVPNASNTDSRTPKSLDDMKTLQSMGLPIEIVESKK